MANLVLGLYSPFKYGIREHEGYSITAFRNNIRFLYVIEDRDNGAGGQICPLFFDGATGIFAELPLPGDKLGLEKYLKYISTDIRKGDNHILMNISVKKPQVRRWKIYLYKLVRWIAPYKLNLNKKNEGINFS